MTEPQPFSAGNWADLWRRLDQPGDPPSLAEALALLVAAALIAADPLDPADLNAPLGYQIHPGIAEVIYAAPPSPSTPRWTPNSPPGGPKLPYGVSRRNRVGRTAVKWWSGRGWPPPPT
ncbi:MAG: hypothetical protein ACRDSH_01930 [Pseudonocardiaceae bacterium]